MSLNLPAHGELNWDTKLNAALNALDRPVTTISSAGTSQSLVGPQHGESLFDVTLTAATCTLSLSGGTSGVLTSFILLVRQDATGGRDILWPVNVSWPGGAPLALTPAPNAIDLINLVTIDGGSTWIGVVAGQNIHAPTAPLAPASVNTAAGNAQVSLTWSTPANGGSPITGYRVYRSTTSSGTQTLAGSPSSTSFTDTGLTNGTTYYYKIAAANAVGVGAQSAEVSATPSGLTTIISDDFNRADNASSMGTADTGQVWPSPGYAFSYWGISANRAYVGTQPGSLNNCISLDSGHADCTVSVALPVLGTNGGPALRITDENNFFYVNAQAGQLWRNQTGGSSQIGSNFTPAVAGDTVSLTASGTTLTVKINGTQVLQVTDSFNQTATRVGLRTYNDTVIRFDTFRVTVP